MKMARLERVDLSSARQRVRLLALACTGIVAFCIVSFVMVPRICPATVHVGTRFSAGSLTMAAATTARRGLHYVSGTGPFDHVCCIYLRFGTHVWFVDARTPIEQ